MRMSRKLNRNVSKFPTFYRPTCFCRLWVIFRCNLITLPAICISGKEGAWRKQFHLHLSTNTTSSFLLFWWIEKILKLQAFSQSFSHKLNGFAQNTADSAINFCIAGFKDNTSLWSFCDCGHILWGRGNVHGVHSEWSTYYSVINQV